MVGVEEPDEFARAGISCLRTPTTETVGHRARRGLENGAEQQFDALARVPAAR